MVDSGAQCANLTFHPPLTWFVEIVVPPYTIRVPV